MGYEVQTPAFEGPFDLLLHLILKQEVDLWEISLAPIVDEYVARVAGLEHLDLDVATEFLLIAATLVELKARRLLPAPEPIDLDEELARWEERDYLLARLLECKTFQDAAHTIHERMTLASRCFARLAGPEHPFCLLSPDPLERVTIEQFVKAAAKGLAPRQLEVRTDAEHITVARVSVREAIEAVLALLPAREPVPFRDLVRDVSSKIEVIVRFLACLELFKQGMVDLDQCENFGDLQVRMLAPGETAELDLESLAEWGDEDARLGALAATEHDHEHHTVTMSPT